MEPANKLGQRLQILPDLKSLIIHLKYLFSVVLFAEFIRGKKAQKSQMGKSGSKPETSSGELDNPWRTFNWREKKELKKRLENFHLSNPEVSHVRILVAGQIGAGKSSFINSVCSAFQGEIVCEALADTSQSASSHSFTERMKVYRIRSGDADLPFEMCDVKGLEPEKISMALPEDIVNIIYGHVRDGYKFSKDKTLPKEDDHYNETPSLSDQAFCLVYVLAGDTLHLHADDNILFEKLRFIRQSISDNGIPQVIVMTKVDEACPLVKNDLKKVYLSKKIKEKMELCSLKLGVPMSNIFPVKNYSEEIDTDDNVDVLILKAFDQIVRFADGRLRRGASTKNS
ncbi:interferon-induced protein 44-like isoform X2 [Pseudorasbora parva]